MNKRRRRGNTGRQRGIPYAAAFLVAGKNLAALNARFGASADFYAKRIELYHCPGAIVLFDNMASLESLWSLLLDAATRHTPSLEPERMPHSGTQVYELLMHHSGLPAEDGPVKDMDDLIRRMTAGMAVLLLDGCKRASPSRRRG